MREKIKVNIFVYVALFSAFNIRRLCLSNISQNVQYKFQTSTIQLSK